MTSTFTKRALLGAGLAGLMLAGCSTTNTYVDYQENNLYSGGAAGNVPFVELGQVTVSERGFVWDSCDALTNRVADRLQADGDALGANRVIDVQWLNHAEGQYDRYPLCTTAWGWFAAAGVGGLGPWVKMAQARGTLVFADDAPLESLKATADDRLQDRLQRQEEARRAAEERRRQEAAEAQAEAEADSEETGEPAETENADNN